MKRRWMIVLAPEGAARQVGLDLADAARQSNQGHDLKVFDTKTYLDGFRLLLRNPGEDMPVDLMNQALVVSALDHGATHVLVLALAPITAFTLALLRRQGLTLIHWFVEDFRQAGYWSRVLPAYSAFYAIQCGPLENACREAQVAFRLLPTATSALAHLPAGPAQGSDAALAALAAMASAATPWDSRPPDLVFVGLPSPYRIRVLEALLHAGASLRLAGTGWHAYQGPLQGRIVAHTVTSQEGQALMRQCRYGLHLPYEDPEIDRANSHVSPRVYDLLALGCLPLIEEGPLLRQALEGAQALWFQGPRGAVEAWHQALSLEEGSSRVLKNRELARSRHTYAHRWESLQSVQQ